MDPNCNCVVCQKGWEGFWQNLDENIQNPGWAVIPTTFEDGDPYAYTLGLSLKGLPELVIFGVGDLQTSGGMVNAMAERMLAGEEFKDRERLDKYLSSVAVPEELRQHALDEYMGQIEKYYNARRLCSPTDIQVRQLVWNDRDFLFPWDGGCNPAAVASQSHIMPLGKQVVH